MSFVRPAAAAALRRWAEPALAGLAALWAAREAVLGLAAGDGLGLVLLAGAGAAALWCRTAAIRALAARSGDAPGLVEVKEREIRHFSPLTGGVMTLDSIVLVEVFVPGPGMTPLWRLTDEDGGRLLIPTTARGAEALPGTFAALPGFSDLAALAALGRTAPGRHPVWRRPAPPGTLRLGGA